MLLASFYRLSRESLVRFVTTVMRTNPCAQRKALFETSLHIEPDTGSCLSCRQDELFVKSLSYTSHWHRRAALVLFSAGGPAKFSGWKSIRERVRFAQCDIQWKLKVLWPLVPPWRSSRLVCRAASSTYRCCAALQRSRTPSVSIWRCSASQPLRNGEQKTTQMFRQVTSGFAVYFCLRVTFSSNFKVVRLLLVDNSRWNKQTTQKGRTLRWESKNLCWPEPASASPGKLRAVTPRLTLIGETRSDATSAEDEAPGRASQVFTNFTPLYADNLQHKLDNEWVAFSVTNVNTICLGGQRWTFRCRRISLKHFHIELGFVSWMKSFDAA